MNLRVPCVLLALAASGLVGCTPAVSRTAASDATGGLGEGFSPAVQRDLATLRTATNAYHDLKAAQSVGYPTNTPGCVADSTMGGMGRHYFDRAVYDDSLKIEHPEMLIYEPTPNGGGVLVGVEYVIPFRLRPSTSTPPRLFGQELRRHEQFQYWYLHVWAWKKNPAGLFSDWNPTVKCP